MRDYHTGLASVGTVDAGTSLSKRHRRSKRSRRSHREPSRYRAHENDLSYWRSERYEKDRNANILQYLVPILEFKVGATFRSWNGWIIEYE